MKILQMLLMAVCLSAMSGVSSVEAADKAVPQAEVTKGDMKNMAKEPRFHRAMSMAMMKDLNLTAEQKAKWKELSQQKNEELKPVREKIKALHEQERTINEAYEGKIKEMLTSGQKKQYESMIKHKPEAPHKKHHDFKKKSKK